MVLYGTVVLATTGYYSKKTGGNLSKNTLFSYFFFKPASHFIIFKDAFNGAIQMLNIFHYFQPFITTFNVRGHFLKIELKQDRFWLRNYSNHKIL